MPTAEHADVVVYTLQGCVHCERARRLLRSRGIPFAEVRGDGVPGFRQQLRERTGRVTMPQITIDGTPVGGAAELARLDRRDLLAPLVERRPFPHAVVRRRLNPVGLLTAPLGGGCGVWRHAVELVERDGQVLERLSTRTSDDARELAAVLNDLEDSA